MSKTKKILISVISVVLVFTLVVGGMVYYMYGYVPSKWLVDGDKSVTEAANYEDELNSLDFMGNTWETAVPQTQIYSIIKKHFLSELPDGKTVKKAIVIGYDGCKAANLKLVKNSERSAILYCLNNLGQAEFSYCGGVNYPEEITQKTSTAPGWCSMLTGAWADVHNIRKNGQPKEIDPRTLLLELVENKTVDSSAFYVSWNGHFSKKNSTYINEKNYIEENGLNVTFKRGKIDDDTKKMVLKDVKSDDCSDFIFTILEYTDHEGHRSGFTLNNPRYVSAFRNADASGFDIIEAIQKRSTYEEEDWLIVITTDHGGFEDEHGGSTIDERITFIVTNKPVLY